MLVKNTGNGTADFESCGCQVYLLLLIHVSFGWAVPG